MKAQVAEWGQRYAFHLWHRFSVQLSTGLKCVKAWDCTEKYVLVANIDCIGHGSWNRRRSAKAPSRGSCGWSGATGVSIPVAIIWLACFLHSHISQVQQHDSLKFQKFDISTSQHLDISTLLIYAHLPRRILLLGLTLLSGLSPKADT